MHLDVILRLSILGVNVCVGFGSDLFHGNLDTVHNNIDDITIPIGNNNDDIPAWASGPSEILPYFT